MDGVVPLAARRYFLIALPVPLTILPVPFAVPTTMFLPADAPPLPTAPAASMGWSVTKSAAPLPVPTARYLRAFRGAFADVAGAAADIAAGTAAGLRRGGRGGCGGLGSIVGRLEWALRSWIVAWPYADKPNARKASDTSLGAVLTGRTSLSIRCGTGCSGSSRSRSRLGRRQVAESTSDCAAASRPGRWAAAILGIRCTVFGAGKRLVS